MKNRPRKDERFEAERQAKREAKRTEGTKRHVNKYKSDSNAGMSTNVHLNGDYTTEKFNPAELTMPYGEYRAMQAQRNAERNALLKQYAYDAAAQARTDYARARGREMWDMPNDLYNDYRQKLMRDSAEAENLHNSWYKSGENNSYIDNMEGKGYGYIDKANNYIRNMNRVNGLMNAEPTGALEGPSYAPEELFYETMGTANDIADMRTKQRIAREMEAKQARRFSAPQKKFGIGDIANMRFMAPMAAIAAYNAYNAPQAQAAESEEYYDPTDTYLDW